MQKRLNDKEKIELVEKYKTGKFTCQDLSEIYGISRNAISGLLKRRFIIVNRNQSSLQRKYSLNECYFDEINTEEKAYFLGLLYADGYNNEIRNCVQLTLQESDKEILELFNKELNSNRPLGFINLKIYNKNHQNCYRLSISSKKISNKLKQIGCPQKKSFIITFPNVEILPNNLIRHFIRGYFDGDGSFSCYYNKPCNCFKWCACIVSTEDFCQTLGNLIKNELNINFFIDKRHKNSKTATRQLHISGTNQVNKFLNWIYDDSSVYLNRKREKFKCMKNYLPKSS